MTDAAHPPSEQEALRDTLVRARSKKLVVRAMRWVGWSFVWVGLFLIGFVLHQLFVTDLLADRAQRGLESDLIAQASPDAEVVPFDRDTGEVGAPLGTVAGVGSLPEEDGGVAAPGVGDPSTTPSDFSVAPGDNVLLREPAPDRGEPLGRLRIPDIGLSWVVVEGVAFRDLRSGAGHMPDTPIPGQPGNAVISGHRTTWGAPFNELDELEPGDRIFWDSAVIGTHTYVVREVIIVEPTALWVTDPRDDAWLTLTTCHPEFSAAERLIVFAEMVDGPNAPVILGEA